MNSTNNVENMHETAASRLKYANIQFNPNKQFKPNIQFQVRHIFLQGFQRGNTAS